MSRLIDKGRGNVSLKNMLYALTKKTKKVIHHETRKKKQHLHIKTTAVKDLNQTEGTLTRDYD